MRAPVVALPFAFAFVFAGVPSVTPAQAAPTAPAVASALPTATARTTIAIVPLVTVSSEEYQWIGAALANALAMRVAMQPELNGVTVRQLDAAIRQDNLEGEPLTDDAMASKLGKLVGADLIVVGTYAASWPSIELRVKAIAPSTGKVKDATALDGELDALIDLEARLATWLAKTLGAAQPNVTPGSFGTSSLIAWRETTLARAVLDWQSLGPQAADPKAEIVLPPEALKKAKEQLRHATVLDPDFGDAWASLGIAQALLGETKDAWRSLGKATALGFGHHPTAVVGASFVRMREGRFEDAAAILTSAIDRHPGFLHARGTLGELYNQMGRPKDALAVYEDYARMAPIQPWVLTQRGYTKGRLGDRAGAINDAIAALDLAPESPSLLISLASRYIDADKLIGAEDALLQALRLFPAETRAYVRLGYVYLLEGKDDLAIPISEKALVQAPLKSEGRDRAYAHLNLARAYGHKGELERAFEHLRLAKAAGVPSFAEIERDAKLTALCKDPRYKKIIAAP